MLKKNNQNLEIELNIVKPFVDKGLFSYQRLDLILNNQKAIFDRASLGFKSYAKQKSTNNLYKKSSNENMVCKFKENVKLK